MTDEALLLRRLDRERRAREQAERLLEEKSLALFESNRRLTKSLERVERREALLKSVLDSVLDGVITLDGTGQVRVFSESARRIFGVAPDDVVGTSIRALIPVFDLDDPESPFTAMVKHGEFNELAMGGYQTVAVRGDGETFPAETAVTQFTHVDTRTLVVTIRDISRQQQEFEIRKDLEAQLRHLQKMESLGTLAGGVAHEFNNMLVPIITLTELSREDLPEDSFGYENLGHVLDAAARARSLVAKVLTFSRKNDPYIEEVEFTEVLAASASLLKNTIPSTTVLDMQIPAPGLIILGDRTELEQIVLNLVGNASAALGGDEGRVEVVAATCEVRIGSCEQRRGLRPGTYIRLAVKDDGCGMDQETAARIFDPFFTTKSVGQGTGLGLAIVHAIIERCQGLIDLETAPNEGTTFTIYLPAFTQSDDQADPERSSEARVA
jgi:two-component system cell cycle sensor histidine kinase/response regulator CckA